MVKDLINAIPTSRGMNSGLDQHLCQSKPSCRPLVSALGSGLTLVLIPDLPSWLVSSMCSDAELYLCLTIFLCCIFQ